MPRILLAFLIFMFGLVNIGTAYVLNFDNLTEENYTFDDQLTNYGDFSWNNFYAYFSYEIYNELCNNTLTPVSGESFAYNGYGMSTSVVGNSLFNFNGAYFTGWATNDVENDGTALSVTIEGYNNHTLVDTYIADLNTGQMQYFDVAMESVDTLVFSADFDNRWFLMDNFTYNEPISAHPVPEPSTLLLFGFGLLQLITGKIKKKIRY